MLLQWVIPPPPRVYVKPSCTALGQGQVRAGTSVWVRALLIFMFRLQLENKRYHHVFMLCGFSGFDGSFTR